MEQNRKGIIIVKGVQWTVVSALLLLSVMPMETSWSDGEWWHAVSLPVAVLVIAVLYFILGSRFRISVVDLFVLSWTLLAGVLTYSGYGVVTPTAFYRFMEMACTYVLLRLLFSLRCVDPRLLIVGIALAILYEAMLGVSQMVEGTSRHAYYPVTGSFLNPGPYAAFLAVGASLLMAQLKTMDGRPWLKRLAWATMFLLFALLGIAFSRAALLAVGIVAWMVYGQRMRRNRWLLWLGVVVVAFGLYWMKMGSAHGRLVIWNISLRAISEQGLLGSGLGSFPHAFAQQSADYFTVYPAAAQMADVCDNAFNEFLTLAVEQGMIGLLLFVAMLVFTGKILYAANRPLFCAGVALLVFALFSYPFQCLSYRLLLVLLCAYAASVDDGAWQCLMGKKYVAALAALTFLLSVGMGKEIAQRKRAADEYRQLAYTNCAYAVDDYQTLLPWLSDNAPFLFDFAKGLSDNGRYNDSNAMLRKGTLVSADPMFYVCMGNNYAAMSLFKEAQQCYQYAYDLLPNRLYPLYKLVKVHEQQHHEQAVYHLAKRIVRFHEKVMSPAVREMKCEAQQKCEVYERKEK